MTKPKRPSIFSDPEEEGEYLGNIFGWKISLIGLGVIILCVGIIAYGHITGQIDYRTGKAIPKMEQTQNSTILDSLEYK